MELKAKLLQINKEKEELAGRGLAEMSLSTSQQVGTRELTISLA